MTTRLATRTEVLVLGPTTAVREGGQIDLGGPKQRVVLALLIIGRGEAVSLRRRNSWADTSRGRKVGLEPGGVTTSTAPNRVG